MAKERAENNRKDSPQAHCLPSPAIRLGRVLKWCKVPAFMVVISDDDSPGFHQIYTDGRPHPKDPNPAWYGHSIGHWEDDTLVVDRVAFDPGFGSIRMRTRIPTSCISWNVIGALIWAISKAR